MQLPMDRSKTADEEYDGGEQNAVIDELVPVPLHGADIDAHRCSPLAMLRREAALAAIMPARSPVRRPAPRTAKACGGRIGEIVSSVAAGFQPADEHIRPECRRARQEKDSGAHGHGRRTRQYLRDAEG